MENACERLLGDALPPANQRNAASCMPACLAIFLVFPPRLSSRVYLFPVWRRHRLHTVSMYICMLRIVQRGVRYSYATSRRRRIALGVPLNYVMRTARYSRGTSPGNAALRLLPTSTCNRIGSSRSSPTEIARRFWAQETWQFDGLSDRTSLVKAGRVDELNLSGGSIAPQAQSSCFWWAQRSRPSNRLRMELQTNT